MTPTVLQYDIITNIDGSVSRFMIVAVEDSGEIERAEHTFTVDENALIVSNPELIGDITETVAAEALVKIRQKLAQQLPVIQSYDDASLATLTTGINNSDVIAKADEMSP